MKRFVVSGALLGILVGAAALADEGIKSGVPVGKRVGTYSTTKCGGVEDGVKVGKSLCYT